MATNQYIVSALKHRPTTFAEVLAQDHVTRTLQHSLERGKIANAFLLVGPRGTGKTTTARILAKALNCETPNSVEPCNRCDSCLSITRGNSIDVIEIDAASNRGVEEMEKLRENVRFTPSQGQYKIFIIDEVHMLSKHAHNAFLKTLEEPPRHAKFILATTELHEIPETILSRCQRYHFRRIPTQVIADHLKRIVAQQQDVDIANPEELDRILFHIARVSEGGLRDALVTLDQMLAFSSGSLSLAEVQENLGVIQFDILERFIRAILQHDLGMVLNVIHEVTYHGQEMLWFLKESLLFLRNLAVLKISSSNRDLLDLPEDYIQQLLETAEQTTLEQILYVTDVFWETERRLKISSEPRIVMEISAIKAAKAGQAVKIKDILQKISSGELHLEAAPQPVRIQNITPAASQRNQITPDSVGTVQKSNGSPAKALEEKLEEQEEPQEAAKPESELTPVPAKPSPPGKDLLSSSWKLLLTDVAEHAPLLGACLQHSVLLDLNEDQAKIAVPSQNSFNIKRLESPASKSALIESLAKHFGKKYKPLFEIRDDLIDPSEVQTEIAPPQEALSKKELLDRVQQDKMFLRLMDEIPGHIIAIDPER